MQFKLYLFSAKRSVIIKLIILQIIFFFDTSVNAQRHPSSGDVIEKKIALLLKKMTLAEKIGQLSQSNGNGFLTGPAVVSNNFKEEIKNGRLGSILNISGVNEIRTYQEIAVNQSRLRIPLLFGQDVIHGYKTIFPVPLAESSSWDLQLMEQSAKTASIEASAAGINWTFAPMVDIGRDPRWGRVVEGAGEDTYLGSKIAAARVRGFQWNIGGNNSVMACAKHFAAYGLPTAGMDYGPVDMSERTLQDIYLPPFKSASDAGVATFMTSFNEINGIPSTGNKWLLKGLLKNKWKFNGFVVSDWTAILQLINEGFAADKKQCAELSFNAGVDMCMVDGVYNDYVAILLKEGKIKITDIDDAVKRILRWKFKLELFDDPYKFLSTDREKATMLKPQFMEDALICARKSIVLLKNDQHILPINNQVKSIAVIGELANSKKDMLGSWIAAGDTLPVVTLLHGLQNKVGQNAKITYVRGCNVKGDDISGFDEAVNLTRQSDITIVAVGEKGDMTGENRSRSTIELPGKQLELVELLLKTGKPVIVVLMNGRPLAIPQLAKDAHSILETWFLGTESGNAIADVLFGDYNPSGKLTITFPRSTGQIPNYYNHKISGRPTTNNYQDLTNEPLYPFGYGLSYTSFNYGSLKLINHMTMKTGYLTVSVPVTNDGQLDGEEIVQLYVRDRVGSVTRPIKELKGFQKVFIKAGETKEIKFQLSAKDLAFTRYDMKFAAEPGEFDLMIGASSADIRQKTSFKIN